MAASSLSLRDLLRSDDVGHRFTVRGFSSAWASIHARHMAACARALMERGAAPDSAARAFFVPGRIEVLGKHTDYCGGRSLLAATEQGFVFVGMASDGSTIEVIDAQDPKSLDVVSFAIQPTLEPRRGHWSNYPMTVARRVARNFPEARRGARLAFASSLPPAMGLSTSSAFMIGVFQVLSWVNDLPSTEPYRAYVGDLESLAAYLATVENGASFGPLAGDTGVGTQGGSEDHTAILTCRAGHLSVYSFSPVRFEGHVRLPEDCVFAVASSGVVAEKTGAAMERYNRASRLARAVVDVWNGRRQPEERARQGVEASHFAPHATPNAPPPTAPHVGPQRAPHIAAILRGTPGNLESLRRLLAEARHPEFSPQELLDRMEHFLRESEVIIPEAADCLERGDLSGFGEAVDRSQERGARLLGNQVPETILLAREARSQGALAASAFGAGFGGSVWAVVRRVDAEGFRDRWRSACRRAFPEAAEMSLFFTTEASTAAFEIGEE